MASPAVFEMLLSKRIVTSLTFRVTWRHRPCDHSIPVGHFLLEDLWNEASISLTVFEIFILVGINRFLIYDFLSVVNGNFCSRTHRLATTYVTYRQTNATLQRLSVCNSVYGRLKVFQTNMRKGKGMKIRQSTDYRL